MFLIEDEHHSEWIAEYATKDAAMDEIRRLAALPWDAEPNRAPCTSWATCGRGYELIEYDTSGTDWREVSRVFVVDISATGVRWA